MYHPYQYEVMAKQKIKELRESSDELTQKKSKRNNHLSLFKFLFNWLVSLIK